MRKLGQWQDIAGEGALGLIRLGVVIMPYGISIAGRVLITIMKG